MQSQWSKEKASSAIRNTIPGITDLSTLASPSAGRGIYEQNESIYSMTETVEEQKLFKLNSSIRTLLEDLEKKDNILVENKNEDKAQ